MTAVAEHTISSAVQGFLNGPKKLYIGGEFVDAASGQTFATYNPADGQKLQTWHTARPKTSTARYAPPERLSRTAPGLG